VDDVDAGLLDAADVEGVSIDELHDDNAEDVFVGQARLRFRRASRWRERQHPHFSQHRGEMGHPLPPHVQ